jgi:hypothetical protein
MYKLKKLNYAYFSYLKLKFALINIVLYLSEYLFIYFLILFGGNI